ncbi:MAG: hypothetical protein IM566_04280 [Pseudanabaena sp. M152S2SP2A07QC]|nr:hypothetical protein [Pseudanabaena sp. M109S1SP2A07QC]MCA6546641.1 hypothetical protein [Pseudanabaena sp. M152S2SP2A07QC]
MSKYIINKSSRYCPEPYSGPTCAEAGVEEGKVYEEYDEAIADAAKLTRYNPVGFIVLDLQKVLEGEARIDREDAIRQA